MAAGLGTRFGSLKQLHPVYNNRYAIIDYSIYDAIKSGFNNIIFIVREEIINVFKTRYEAYKFPKNVSVEFINQSINDIPENVSTKRKKPWGTGHALLTLKKIVNEPFALINADDFYGRASFKLMHDALYKNNTKDNFFIGYNVSKTLSETGSVSRGECFLSKTNDLKKITERTKISKSNDELIYYLNEDNKQVNMPSSTIVSMNFWGFTPDIFPIAETLFSSFLQQNSKNDIAELYLPSIVDHSIQQQIKSYKMLLTEDQWFGITYKEDEQIILKKIKQFINQGLYPEILW